MKNSIILALALILGGSVYAQTSTQSRDTSGTSMREDRQERRAEMRAQVERQKIAFITTEVKMTPEEGQKFWPLYNAYQSEKQSIMDADFRTWKGRSEAEVTAAELDARMKAKFAMERKRVETDERYYGLYKQVLPADKLAAFYKAEINFQRELMREMRGRGDAGSRDGYRSGQMDRERQMYKRDEMRVKPAE